MDIHLLSYGDHNYMSQKDIFFSTAVESGFFDKIIVYGPEDMDRDFVIQFTSILRNAKGGGYWIWKPYFVRKVFETLPEGDVLIYCDVGCLINQNGKKRFEDYIELLSKSKTGSLAFELPHKEVEYTKQEVFNFFDSPSNIIHTNQLMATVFLLKKCDHSMLLVNKWFETLCTFPEAFIDDHDPVIKNEEFIDARHDQSVFSIIRKWYGSEIIPDETYFNDFVRDGENYPFWATRLKR